MAPSTSSHTIVAKLDAMQNPIRDQVATDQFLVVNPDVRGIAIAYGGK